MIDVKFVVLELVLTVDVEGRRFENFGIYGSACFSIYRTCVIHAVKVPSLGTVVSVFVGVRSVPIRRLESALGWSVVSLSEVGKPGELVKVEVAGNHSGRVQLVVLELDDEEVTDGSEKEE